MAKTQMMREAQSGLDWARGERQWNGKKKLNEEKIARGLGWFSIGLGLAQVATPRRLAKLIGVRDDHGGLLRMLGVREIASGIGILTERRPTGLLASPQARPFASPRARPLAAPLATPL